MRLNLYAACLYLLTLTGLGLVAAAPAAGAGAAAAAEKLLAGIEQATWVKEGKGPHVIYVFFDPNCPYCHQLYLATRDWIKRGAVELRWIPVGVLATTSLGKAASILDAKDPLQAFYRNEDHYARSEGGGGIDEGMASDEAEKALSVNADLLRISGFEMVPLMVFRAKDGEAIMIRGAPPVAQLKLILEYVK